MSQRIALVDCNNFYVSCERLFRPDLRKRPVAVLSNNDGCIVARSQEVKALGIKMGVPVFKVQDLVHQHQIQLFSSNYTLYADMSHRVMTTLAEFTPSMEVYSIDEAFLDFTRLYACRQDPEDYAQMLRKRVLQYTGIPVCVGMGPTKTLAKLANFAAKKWSKTGGVLDISPVERRQALMAMVPVGEVWGIGRRITQKLNQLGIETALDLARQPPEKIQTLFNVVVARTVMELNGVPCLALEEITPDRKQIVSSRSFGYKLTRCEELFRALSDYTSRAAEKLRRQQSVAGHLSIFIHTNPFNLNESQYHQAASSSLPVASNDTRLLLAVAHRLLLSIFKEGYHYHKCGVILSDIRSNHQPGQTDLFSPAQAMGSPELMETLDAINRRYPRSTVIASAGFNRQWKAKADRKTPNYTTRWDELIRVG